MKLSIFAVGRVKAGAEQELCQRYFSRVQSSARSQGISGLELREFAESRARDTDTRKNQEAGTICDALSVGSVIIALDEHGKNLDSEAFASLIGKHRDTGIPEICFIIGGADGLGRALQDRADITVSFGKLTWPHMLVRIMLAEQIYRAITILSGHPYHRR